GMEVCLSSGCRMSGGTAGRDDGLQNPAGALGKGLDSGLEEDTPASLEERRFAPPENRSLVSPDGQPQLSADDRALGFAHACHDHSFLPGMVPDAVYRPSPLHGFDVFDFQLLSGFAERTFSKELVSVAVVPAFTHG